ncbi:hypothetical protein BU107_13915 [Staphylococcus xylosus]|uniref:hypothetical protein n=1 Tax=Staphylococcus xylosus TaxID=1288 RepID=UPI000E690961|nr:hypothetical protein [Staphylococcus xylosus]RIM84023.1 hypothetical protein BU107_13915 [Staphylococcus xylosus]
MEFIIKRTRGLSDNKPLDIAYLKQVENYDDRTISTFEEFDKRFGRVYGEFTSKGRDHKINSRGRIQRTFDEDEWCVNIEDLNRLVELSKVEDDIIIINTPEYNLPVLEIYNDYRE